MLRHETQTITDEPDPARIQAAIRALKIQAAPQPPRSTLCWPLMLGLASMDALTTGMIARLPPQGADGTILTALFAGTVTLLSLYLCHTRRSPPPQQ